MESADITRYNWNHQKGYPGPGPLELMGAEFLEVSLWDFRNNGDTEFDPWSNKGLQALT